MQFVGVALSVPRRSLFTYKVPDNLHLSVGQRVNVPFHNKSIPGIVIELNSKLPLNLSESKIKLVNDVLNDGDIILSKELIDLAKWISSYYFAPIGEVVKMMLPSHFGKIKMPNVRVNAKSEIGSLNKVFPDLNNEQLIVIDSINKTEKPYLLYGITGSGKTEIYISLVERMISKKKSSIVLVPEIGLTSQQINRFASKIGKEKIAVYHSGLTDSKRFSEWMRIKNEEGIVVIGTRSALFTPVNNLGIIIVDEEHDSSFKQEDGVKYNARDTAVVRGKKENAIVVLGSATPSIQSMYNAKNGKYELLELKNRPSGLLPDVSIVDLKGVERFRNYISTELSTALHDCKSNKKQAIIFLNRRGFASQVVCKDCGFIYECPNCDIALTYHKNKNSSSLVCHYCGYKISAPQVCSKCESPMLLLMGRGTQRIEGEISRQCEDLKIARLDSDSGSVKDRKEILMGMDSGKVDVLIGTQMVTKGHDFPNLSLVGVAFADTSLYFPDFMAPERTFQLISQVAGRAGRRDMSSKVIVQTYQPEHYAILAAKDHDYMKFYNQEIIHRKELGYPPFMRLASIKISGNVEENVEAAICSISNYLRKSKNDDISILGPAPCPQRKVRGKYRWHLLIKSKKYKSVGDLIQALLNNEEKIVKKGVSLLVDVDPISLI